MRRITALWEAFFSKELYWEAFYSWKGIGFLILLLLAAIQTLVLLVKIHLGIYSFVHHDASPIVKQIPPVTFKDGKAITPERKAYEVKDPDSGKLIAIIDTRVPQPPADLGGAPIYIAEESATYEKSDIEKRSYDYKSMEGLTVDEKAINYWLNVCTTWAATVCAPFIFGFLLVWILIQLLVFSLFTLLVCNQQDLIGSYAGQLRLTTLAMVPGLVIEIFFSAFHINFSGSSVLTCVIVIGYIIFGVFAVRTFYPPSDSEDEVPPVIPQ